MHPGTAAALPGSAAAEIFRKLYQRADRPRHGPARQSGPCSADKGAHPAETDLPAPHPRRRAGRRTAQVAHGRAGLVPVRHCAVTHPAPGAAGRRSARYFGGVPFRPFRAFIRIRKILEKNCLTSGGPTAIIDHADCKTAGVSGCSAVW